MSNRIRFECDNVLRVAFAEILDELTGAAPALKQSTITDFEVAFFENGVFKTDFTGITKAVITVKAQSELDAAALMTKEVLIGSIDTGLLESEWDTKANNQQHAKFSFDDADTFIELGGAKIRDLFVYVDLETASGVTQYCAAPLYLLDSGKGDVGAITITPVGARMKSNKLQVLNQDDSLYYDVVARKQNGVPVLSVEGAGEA